MDFSNVTPNAARQQLRQDLQEFAKSFITEPRREVAPQSTAVQDVTVHLPMQRSGKNVGGSGAALDPVATSTGVQRTYRVIEGGVGVFRTFLTTT